MCLAKPWTNKQMNCLLIGTAAYGIRWLQTNTNSCNKKKFRKKRTINALRCKAYRMGIKGLNGGTKNLKQLSETTGYSKTLLFRAQKAMRQKWLRSSEKGNYLITINQVEELLDWLKEDYWSKSKRLYNCVYCGNHNNPHVSWGLCKVCLQIFRKICKKHRFFITKELLVSLCISNNKEARAFFRKLKKRIAISEDKILKIINTYRS